ncbi:MAG: 6,7-dimethyl-8-ribityllumazine synthase [Verrucomicrobiales bacterium]|nr:6,7-dimethyl-8-ribityllumazine synthase [Verrucomicrobiales bacterium]
MLTTQSAEGLPSGSEFRFTVVASKYNAIYVDGLVRAALGALQSAGAPDSEVLRVPGSWEIPVVAATVARRSRGRPDAILCFGVIWQGETLHAQHIGDAVSDALMRLAVESGIPVIHQVLTVSTEEQAVARCLNPDTNRGLEAARTALEMARLLRNL